MKKLDLGNYIIEREPIIKEWLYNETKIHRIPFYSSADLRDSNFKMACVDLNLFPAGFNNLCHEFIKRSISPIQKYINEHLSKSLDDYKNVLIVPESHSKNPFYNTNLFYLKNALEAAGLTVSIAATQNNEISTELDKLTTSDGQEIPLTKIKRLENQIVGTSNQKFDWIILNNDLAAGPLDWLRNLTQPLIPPMCLGWHKRSKFVFFELYNRLIKTFCELIDLDNFFLSIETKLVESIDFNLESDRIKIAEEVENVLDNIRENYKRLNIDETPHVFLKNDSGTYGMGIMSVKSGQEILNMNRKQKNKMSTAKGNQPIKNIIIQEGIVTKEIINNKICEPVIYMIGDSVIGTFYRAHAVKNKYDNLNSVGMEFFNYCSISSEIMHSNCSCTSNDYKTYGILSMVGALAAAYETELICK